jgi:redox-sensitive bicupin YhaK (pirin superfamily)
MNNIEIVIAPREKDLGGFSVRRILPYATHRMVGPFIFFDHMGPAEFLPGTGMDVRPHPHIGLATVTYLFEGKIRHRDSLGSDLVIEPGAINWMTAGKGIVHSERTPDDVRNSGGKVNGIQIWVALPNEHEDTHPTFVHHPAHSLPVFDMNGIKGKVLLGSAFGHQSPVQTHSPLFYVELLMPKGSQITFPAHGEAAAYVAEGSVRVDDQQVDLHAMAVIKKCHNLEIEALEDSRILIIGGEPVGERFIFWNFVASSKEKLEKAKRDWTNGPGEGLFTHIPDDNQEFIPLPVETGNLNPKGTAM